MTLHLRPATPEDYPFLVHVHNVVVPDVPVTLELLRRREAGRAPALVYRRYIAERGGQPVGQGFYSQQEWMFHPQKFALNVQVLPEFQGQGVGSALWQRFEDELRPHRPIKLFVSAREDRAASLKFLTRRGFTEEQRDRKSVLDLTTACLDGLDAALARIRAQGYSVTTFADYDVPDKERRFYDFGAQVGPDAPRPPDEEFVMPSFERYWAPVSRQSALRSLAVVRGAQRR
jgi:mycothiol synthase